MCGIFGIISKASTVERSMLATLAKQAEQRGRDSSGLVVSTNNTNQVYRADAQLSKLFDIVDTKSAKFAMGHSRLITDGFEDNQPVVRDGVIAIHNGIITNVSELFEAEGLERHQEIDTEILPALYNKFCGQNLTPKAAAEQAMALCEGVVSAILIDTVNKCICFLSNNKSFYFFEDDHKIVFTSEEAALRTLGINSSTNLYGVVVFENWSIPDLIEIKNTLKASRINLIPKLADDKALEKLLVFPTHDLQRCTKCILPSSMPFINFDDKGVCNYCKNYKKKSVPNNLEKLSELLEPYRRSDHADCIMPFSGGRDSCFALHLVVEELKMKPVTFTYDWGMVTDLGRRNISRMSAKLGVENIIIAADIQKKRLNIKKNLEAWLKRPHLGMISLLTAGDKFFFQHVETVKRQTGISLNLWGVNPLETTHFKSGFLGIPPAFMGDLVYSSGLMNQLKYQSLRLGQMVKNPNYFNSSLGDTLTGEYWRSIHKKSDYFHLFDFYNWEENEIEATLDSYNWERAADTNTTWRIGDGTAAFYNYVYYTVAGFTEHDTFRSNQIREGQITRAEAIEFVKDENTPRLQNIKWYLESVDVDPQAAINIVNKIPRLY